MGFRAVGDAALAVHVGFLAYVLLGGVAAWRWPRTIVAHASVICWAALSVTITLPCPLTGVQNWGREHGGQSRLVSGFIDTYIRGTLYPAGHERLAQALVGLVVLVSWLGYAWRSATRRRTFESAGKAPARR